MNKNSFPLVLGGLAILGGLFFFGNAGESEPAANAAASASALAAEPGFYDFGEVPLYGGTVSTVFTLKNEGSEDIVITSGTTSCGCTEGEIDDMRFGMHEDIARPFMVPAGESTELKVIYDPFAHGPSGVGLAERLVYLKTNSRETPEVEVKIRALVVNTGENTGEGE